MGLGTTLTEEKDRHMMSQEFQEANLEVHLSHPVGGTRGDRVAELVLKDRTSRNVVAVLELTATDFHNLMSGRSRGELEGKSYLANPDLLTHLNKERCLVARRFRGGRDILPQVTDWAGAAAIEMRADHYVADYSHGYIEVRLTFYSNDLTSQEIEGLADRLARLPAHFAPDRQSRS